MDDKPQITFNGRIYDLVTLGELTLDEAIVLYDYSHVSLADLPDLEGFHPGVVAALLHISIARVEIDETPKTIRKAVLATPIADLETIFASISEEEDEAIPPQSGLAEKNVSASTSGASGADGEPDTAPTPASGEANGSGTPPSGIGATSGPARLDG